MPVLPLTPVGKLFKPALVMREIEALVAEEALRVGIAIDRVAVRQDVGHGYIAKVSLSRDAGQLFAALAEYPFRTERSS